jgi:hypothetical protein
MPEGIGRGAVYRYEAIAEILGRANASDRLVEDVARYLRSENARFDTPRFEMAIRTRYSGQKYPIGRSSLTGEMLERMGVNQRNWTRKDYWAFARILAENDASPDVIDAFSQLFYRDNHQFDRNRFESAVEGFKNKIEFGSGEEQMPFMHRRRELE